MEGSSLPASVGMQREEVYVGHLWDTAADEQGAHLQGTWSTRKEAAPSSH